MITRTRIKVTNARRKDYERVVQNGLAVTPSDMQVLAAKGIPVSPQNLGLGYQDGVSKLDFQPPIEYTRGVDINDLWEARQQVKDKVRRAKGKLTEVQPVKSE